MIINIIRAPIDTILSGYNYHLFSDEKWLKKPLLRLLKAANAVIKYREARHLRLIDFKQTHLKCNALVYINKTNVSNDTVSNIYNNHNMSFGLYLEYNRYFSCQYDAVYGTYKLINDLQNKQNKN